ncbi:MAG TPA: hypothetical protein VGE55_01765 [Limnobacter sp.]|uniref:hypothetical protein n=1 Tax=Limnobacter sp. TaxID=2003368 RepID=UPI002EDA0657
MLRFLLSVGMAGLLLSHSVQAVELGRMEIRSQAGMPFIAHIALTASPQELSNPESVVVNLVGGDNSDFQGSVRTRLFLQPQGAGGFLRVTALDPLPRSVVLTFSASTPDGPLLREYAIDNGVVRTRDIQRPKPPAPPAPTPVLKPVAEPEDADVNADKVLEPAPPEGIELRLLDQTNDGAMPSPRATASDLELLAKSDAALNADPNLREQARTALGVMGQLKDRLALLFQIKASKAVVEAAVSRDIEQEPSSYTLTLQTDAKTNRAQPVTETGSAPDKPLAPVQSPAVGAPASASAAPASSASPSAQTQPQQPVAKPAQPTRGNDLIRYFVITIVFAVIVLVAGYAWMLRNRPQWIPAPMQSTDAPSALREEPVLPAPQTPVAALPNRPELPEAMMDEPVADAKPTPQAAPPVMASLPPEPDFDDTPPDWADADDDAIDVPPAAQADAEVTNPMVDVEPERFEEPEFKNENDARIELAAAYMEIEDFDAAMKLIDSIEGELTEVQMNRLQKIREEMTQGEADQ